MSDRARLVYALLRTLFAWTPGPRSDPGLARVPRGFAGGDLRYTTCEDCLANGKTMPGCETCGGRGELPDPRPDPYETKNATKFGGVAAERRADAERRILDELKRLERQLSDDEADAPDRLLDAIDEARRRQYAHGSYAELERALVWLRHNRPVAYTAAMWVAYQPLGEAPVDCERPAIIGICEVLARVMEGPIRVPEYVAVSMDQAVELLAREGKGALWRGRGDWHLMRRHERDALIVAMRADGHSWTEIALRFNVTRRRVQQIVAEKAERSVATGPAA